MRNKFGDGKVIDLLNGSGVDIASGGIVVEGNLVGVATQTHPNGSTLPCEMEGEFDLTVADTVGGGIGRGDVLTCTLATGVIANTAAAAGVIEIGHSLGALDAGLTGTLRVRKFR